MKTILFFAGVFVLSICVSTLCEANGFYPWQTILVNVAMGAALGLVTGLSK